jgi:RNase P/RNase MRP subunit POP5
MQWQCELHSCIAHPCHRGAVLRFVVTCHNKTDDQVQELVRAISQLYGDSISQRITVQVGLVRLTFYLNQNVLYCVHEHTQHANTDAMGMTVIDTAYRLEWTW